MVQTNIRMRKKSEDLIIKASPMVQMNLRNPPGSMHDGESESKTMIHWNIKHEIVCLMLLCSLSFTVAVVLQERTLSYILKDHAITSLVAGSFL